MTSGSRRDARAARAAESGRRTRRPRGFRAPRYRRDEPVIEQNRLIRSFAEWRIAIRLGRRSVMRTLGTSVVVTIMVALPVAGFSAAALVGESSSPTAAEKITAELGQNEARLYTYYAPDPALRQDPFDPGHVQYDTPTGAPENQGASGEPVDPRELFPAGTDITELTQTQVSAETAAGRGSLVATVGPVWDESFTGRFTITSGSAPRAPTEIMATEAALGRLGATVGSTVTLTQPQPIELTIVGVLDDQMTPDSIEELYLGTSTLDPGSVQGSTSYYLPDTVIERSDLDRLNAQGVTVLSRAILSGASSFEVSATGSFWLLYGVVLVLAAAFAVFEIILLAGAAFAVGARKQQRALATVASVGGGRRLLFRIVTAQGLVLGLLGGLIGVAVGIPAGAIFMAFTGDGSASRYWGFHLNPLSMVVIAALAAIVGLIAAIAPARSATKFDTLAALRGSRKPAPLNRKRPVVGLVFMIGGAALTLVGALVLRIATERVNIPLDAVYWTGIAALLIGPILAQIGIIMCGALVLRTIARGMSRIGLGARLASRDSATNPSRAVPAFAAIMVTAFIGVLVINFATSTQHSSESSYQYQIPLGEVQAWMPVDMNGELTADPGDVTAALERDLDVESSAVMSSVRVERSSDGALIAAVPMPSVPPQNLCPLDENSPEYDADVFDDSGSADHAEARRNISENDWRCGQDQGGYVDSGAIHILDPNDLALLLGVQPSTEARDALQAGGAVSFRREYVADGELTIDWWPPEIANGARPLPDPTRAVASETIPAVVQEPDMPMWFGLVITPQTAESLGLAVTPSAVVASLDTPATQAQLDATTEALEALGSSLYYEQGPSDGSLIWILGALGLCGVLFLGASAVAIGLARADGRQDDATLAAVGATRMLRRTFAFWQAMIIAGIGAVTGTLAALLTSYAFSLIDPSGSLMFLPPWPVLAALVVGMPLLIAAGSWLVASKPTTLARRVAIG
ncbi:hypothetical protein GCM10027416_15900 [Okibacterium endophyticum]